MVNRRQLTIEEYEKHLSDVLGEVDFEAWKAGIKPAMKIIEEQKVVTSLKSDKEMIENIIFRFLSSLNLDKKIIRSVVSRIYYKFK